MRHINTRPKEKTFFTVLADADSSQAAMMALKPGQSTSEEGPVNEHPRCEQWIYVVRGTGRATVGKRRAAIKEGSLLLIEKGEPHEIVNTGRRPLVTLNLYAPRAYTSAGDLRLTARVPTIKSTLTRAARRGARRSRNNLLKRRPAQLWRGAASL
jgi:mannose-6-phosphate isomerase-like protein (cupin superfamily)